MMGYTILCSESINSRGIDLLRSRPGFKADVRSDLSQDVLSKIIADYDGLLIREEVTVDEQVLRHASRLRVIGIAGPATESVDVAEATRHGVVVLTSPGLSAVSLAEHTIALVMAVHRHIPQAVLSTKQGKWEKKKFQGREIAGRTMGLIGLGKVGSLVSERASRGLKMNVLGYDPMVTRDAASRMGTRLVSLDELLASSDVISVQAPLNESTRGLLDDRAFAAMKESVIVVSCGREGIVDSQALLRALEDEKVAGVGLDLFSEPSPADRALIEHPRVVVTPHLGPSTDEAEVNVALAAVEQLIDYLENGVAKSALNVPAVDAKELPRVGPYMDLAWRLARFAACLVEQHVTELEVEYRGQMALWDVKPITNAALVGLLNRTEGPEVNAVNASYIAQQRGICVSETANKQARDRISTLVIRLGLADGSSRSVQGAFITRETEEPRITGIDNYVTEAEPAGAMLVITNRDIPGMVAGITRALADRGINIAQMNLSRDAVGGEALSIINLDTPADRETLERIGGIDGILNVRQVILGDRQDRRAVPAYQP
jgi:D-3-phosphoglycerate dehydrogenase